MTESRRQTPQAGPHARVPDLGPDDVIRGAQAYLAARAQGDSSVPQAAAWEQFYRDYDPLIRVMVRDRTRRGAQPADGIQEVWALLVRRLPGLHYDPRRGPFRAWLRVFVGNALADRARRTPTTGDRGRAAGELDQVADRLDQVADRGPGPCDEYERRRALGLVAVALAELRSRIPERSYDVVRLRRLEGLSVGEVAARLRLTPAQVWARDHRSLRQLRGIMARLCGGDLTP